MATINHYVIEVGECGLVRTLHEPIEGPVIVGDRGSKKYVCGQGENPFPWPTDPFLTKTFMDEPQYPPVVSTVTITGGQVNVFKAQSNDFHFGDHYSSYFKKTVEITVHCGCKEPPVDPPIVPLPAGGVLLASALVISFMLKRA